MAVRAPQKEDCRMKPSLLTGQGLVFFLLLLGVAMVFFYGRFYIMEARQARRLTPRQRRILWLLRALVALLALLALARPALTLVKKYERLPVVAFLLDESSSMAYPDARDNPLVQSAPPDQRARYDTARNLLQRLQEPLTLSHRVRVFSFSDLMRLICEAPHRENRRQPPMSRSEVLAKAAGPTGEYTNLGDALAESLRDLSGNRVSGIVVLSDGRQTGGLDLGRATEQAVQAGIPVHAVAMGTEFPLRDLRIDEVAAPPEASLGDVLAFDVKIGNQIQERLQTALAVEEEGKEAARKTVYLKRGENRVTIAMIPDTEGTRKFRIYVPTFPDEVNTENNETVLHVKVVKRVLKVLLVASHPTREYLYMTPALLRDPVVGLSCWLQDADIDYIQQGNRNITRLPETLAEWMEYDVAILYDPDPNKLTTQQVTGIENMVRKGGGLMIIAGRNHGMAKLIQVHAVKMRNMMPVEIDKNLVIDTAAVYENSFETERTPQGRGHPILLISGDEARNEEIWKTFPRFFWSHQVEGLKPAGVSLLSKRGETGGAATLMAIHRYGEGAVFYSGIDSLWLWRYPYESFDYDRFWVRAIRYLGETRLSGSQQQVSLDTERQKYAPGEQVLLRLRVLDPALMSQLKGLPLFTTVAAPSGEEQAIPMSPDPGGEMRYTGNYLARRTGSMLAQCKQAAPQADSEAKPLFDVKHAFQVEMQSLEARDTSGDLEAMRLLAEKTGGRYYDYRNMREIDELVSAIPKDMQVIKESRMVELWDGLPFLLLVVILVGGEWALRKAWGLL
jgi:hypothetical protein